ncbi:MAG: M28 family peptidase, partial [Gemmatimonadota bacterium]
TMLAIAFAFLGGTDGFAQMTPWYQWTLLPPEIMDEIIGETSGETAWNTIMETGGYNRDRVAAEYAGTFYEAQYIYDQLQYYGLPGAELVRFPGGEVWDGIKGELWEVSPMRQKLASYQDMRAMLASGSNNADVTADLVWVGVGSPDELERAGVAGKIVVTEGSIGTVHRQACLELGALGVVSIANSRPFFDPLQIPWSGVGSRRGGDQQSKFGFFIPPREAQDLKRRLLAGQTITVHTLVESTTRPYELQDPVAHIPGTDPNAGEIILSAHLFEGYVKQGANDNKSGSATVLEVARTLNTLIVEGRIPRPKRTIRFLWGPEYSGTGPWVVANKDIMERTLANINMDMVGEWLSLNKSYMTLVRTSYGHPHFINDVMENYYRFVGESNHERIQNRREFFKVPRRIVAPTGADEPFYYSIETHYGASDHMVFNDWGVGVPGIMMIAWPDQWYHTSGDRIDKADPTQLKRVAVIGAAGAYTVASADDDMAIRLAGEIASNGTRRLGHQFIMAQERLNQATLDNLPEQYRWARAHIEGSLINERATLESVLQLATDESRVGEYVRDMQGTVDRIGQAHLAALETHMEATAAALGCQPLRLQTTDLERRAASMVPRPTALVKQDGYRGWRSFLEEVPTEARQQYPYGDDIASTNEVNLLINGSNSILDIKKMLDAQYKTTSDIQAIINYIEILKLAGLVEM